MRYIRYEVYLLYTERLCLFYPVKDNFWLNDKWKLQLRKLPKDYDVKRNKVLR